MKTQAWIVLLCIIGLASGGRKDRKRNEERRRRNEERRKANEGRERTSRGLVPQLLPNYTEPSLPPPTEVNCANAFMACAYRDGCGVALQQYELTCSNLVTGITDTCSRSCQHALIALLSTTEGQRLMECRCENEDCELKKKRIEPCRAAVTWQSSPSTQVSCSAASWICLADPLCAKALDYYNLNCRAMFKGRRCGKKCHNSLDILLRQKAASKLATCYCDGTEDYDCAAIRENTDTLCFGKKKVEEELAEAEDNTIEGSSRSSAASKPAVLVAVFSVIFTYLIPDTIASLRELMIVTL